jgi:NAD(P)-dependent dehydrogenase (short-subunit alcohol dehydrogenase family)
MNNQSLARKVALVTGAGSGIGRASAVLLAGEGATLGLLGRTEDELRETASEIEKLGGRAHVLVADVSDATAVDAAVQRLARAAGGLHIVFANAGINGVWAPIDELAVDEWKRTLAINLDGTFFTIKSAVPHLRTSGGSIIVCSSVNGTRMFSNTGATAYACSKAAQVALVKMLAVELGRYRIRVNAICPGAIDTEIDDNTERRDVERVKPRIEPHEATIPLTRGVPGTARQVAQVVLFLAGDSSDHVTGTELWVDGAQSLVEG